MPRRRDEDPADLPPEESSVTQYDSPSDSTHDSERSSQSGHTTHSTSLHSGRSRRLAAPVPVHAQGLYRADGLEYRQLPPAGTAGGANLRRAPSTRGVRDMYDPELHDEPPLPPNAGKDAVSGDSLSYGSQPEYVHYVNPPPLSGIGPYSWADSTSGTSQELYFRGQRKYFKRSFCSVCLSVSIVSVIIAVIGIVAIAAYLGVMTTDDSEAMKYEMQYSGKFRVARGDFFHPMLADTSSVDFQDKAERYQKMIETLYGYSYLSDAFRRASVERFGNDSLTVFFRVHLDRRKIPTSVLNTEEAVRDVVTQEVMSLEPRAFRSISVDIDSIEIKREQKDGVSTAPFVSRGGGGSRRQEIDPDSTGPEDTSYTTEEPGQDDAPHDTTMASDEQPDATDGPKDESTAPDTQVEPARAQPSTEKGAGGNTMSKEEVENDRSQAAAPEVDAKGEETMDQETSSDKEQMADNSAGDQEKPTAEVVEPTGAKGPTAGVTGQESQPNDAPAGEMTKETALDQTEVATKVAETGANAELDKSQEDTSAETVSDPSDFDHPLENHPQDDHDLPNHDPEHRTSSDSSPVDVSTTDPPVVDPSPLDIKQENENNAAVTQDTASYDVPESFYYDDDFYDVTTEGAIGSDPADQSIPYEVIDQPSSYEPSAPISDEVATELAPFLAASVPQGVNRVGYVDPSAPANAPEIVAKPAQPPSYSDFADVQVGTAYFGGLAPAPTATAAPAPPAVWAQLGDSGPASAPAPAPAPAPVPSPAGQQDNWPQLQRPATATDSNDDESPLYDFSPWNPIIPAFVQAGGQAGRPGSLFVDGGGVRRGGEYPPAVTVQPRPNLNGAGQVFAADDVAPDGEATPAPEVTTSRRPFVQVTEQLQPAATNRPAAGRPQYASIPIPESVSIQQTLQILPEDGDAEPRPTSGLGSAETPDRLSPSPVVGSRPESLIINRPRPRPRPRPSNRPAVRPFTTDYRTEVSTSEISEESQAAPGGAVGPGALADLASLLEPAGGVDRLGIAFITRPPPTRQPVTAPTATTTQRVVVVNAAPAAAGDVGPAVGDVTPSRPELPPVTTFSGVYPPLLRPRPSSGTPTQQQVRPDQTESLVGGANPVVVSAVPDTGFEPLRPRPALPTGGASGVLAGALGGALSGAPDGPSAPGDVSAPSREQLLNLFRLIALRYPALVANMDQQQLQLLLNDEEARRKLLAPFLAADKSRTPGEPQRTNTKLLELANISINGTRLDRRDDGRSLRREVPSRAYGNSAPPPPPRRGEFSRLSSSVLQALANFTRVKVAGGSSGGSSNEASGEASGETDAMPERLPTGPAGSLSDRLHQLAGFPTRAPPHRGNATTPGSSRSKLSHKLMRFHGERTNADGGEYNRAPLFAALRDTTVAPRHDRRNPQRGTTRLPNSSPVHVIRYREGETVRDILDKIFARFQQKPNQNELKLVYEKPWSATEAREETAPLPVSVTGYEDFPIEVEDLPIEGPATESAETRFSASETVVTAVKPNRFTTSSPSPTLSKPAEDRSSSSEDEAAPREDISRPTEDSLMPAEVAEEADNEIGTAQLGEVPSRPTLASMLRNPTTASCTDPTDFACRTLGGCVPASSRCDRLLDCADGSDERDCTCADRLRAQALHSKLCDGVVDCHDSSDEKFCEWCRPDQFICPEAKHCIDRSALCDGRFDCADGADERHCVTLAESATHAETGDGLYSDSGLLLVRKRGVWGRLCVDQLDGVVRQSRGSWGADELGRAVCKALTYQDAKGVKSVGPNVTDSEVEATEDPFFKLLFSPNTVLPEAEKASLVFAEDTCPRQSALHVTCDTLQCGLRPRVKQRQARIVGGGNSSPGAWPWQAAMYRDGEYQCGATLISDRWLLSAGHCYLRSTTRYWLARLGAYRRGSSLLSPYERLHEVSHVIMHPEYQDVGYVHDIALLRLREPVQMSDFVRPACLPPPKTEIQNGALCTVVGWGQLFESGKIFPDTLQEVQVPLISSQECKKRTVFLPLYKITENMFCAGYERGGRDACLGDSGGPLMCQEASGEWTLTGITSNGYGCARAGRPGVYTKVSNYASWIDDVIGGSLPPAPRHACRGHRCRLGRCLSPDEVCDGIVHCSDGGDEEECPANTTTTLPASAEGQSQQL